MDSIPSNSILKFNPDTMQYLRTLYELEKPGRMEEAINILTEWIKKQEHLIKKDFSREHIERMIISSKGSVERAKVKYDKVCTFKTLLPEYFQPFDLRNMNNLYTNLLPKMTKDHFRVLVHKNTGDRFQAGFFDFYKSLIFISEYVQAHDYCNGVVVIIDFLECNLMELVKNLNLSEVRNTMSIVMEGYGMKIKGINFLSDSKAMDTFLLIFKQALSSKVAQRIHVHKDVRTLYEQIDRDILPVDYGGEEKSIKTLSDDLMSILTSDGFMEYFKMMKQARTNKTCKSLEKFNDHYMGVPGSFRKLNLD